MTRNEQLAFIQRIAPIISSEASKRGYSFPSAIIAQACLESRYGDSALAKYHNYFGLKCGSSWKGASVNMTTKEEYRPGTLTTIKDNFRAYASMEEGVRGYFDFISTSRYANLKEATSSKNYLERIKSDGYATSSTYVSNVYAVVNMFSLTIYDEGKLFDTANKKIMTTTANLNMRKSPGTDAQILATISKGSAVIVNKWVEVEINGTTGYCHSDYLK